MSDRPEATTAVPTVTAAPARPAQGENPFRPPEPAGGLRRLLLPLGIAVALLCGAYGVGCHHFSTHFVPGTTVDGMDASGLTQAELAQAVTSHAEHWTTTVSGDGIDLTLSAGDIGLSIDGPLRARRARQQADPARWVLDLVSPNHIDTGVDASVSQEAVLAAAQAAADQVNATATAPVNAFVSYDEGQHAFTITSEVAGTQVDAAAVARAITEASLALSPSVTLGDGELVQAAVRADDARLAAARDEANRIIGVELPLTRGSEELARVTRDLSAAWVAIDDDYAVSVSQDAIRDWAAGELGARAATSDEVHDYGLDADALAETLASQLDRGDGTAIELPLVVTATRPEESQGAHERGRHVDLNLSTQYARLYDSDGGVLWRSYFVSGNTSERRSTPTGRYAILAKRTNETLIGADEDKDGKPDYKSHVNYWMPFIGNTVGMHDAGWRRKFGGSIYQYNGSHGCVNLPSDAAQELYALVNVGDAVYVHW
ncbi:L,D-transpeptidase [Olsenella sp. HMSC062G07]|uniref:L,D-transpeptidase n=1 Tax=Olsenella sp. HMSC062G07 TaxID=1739330 RepID=UPI0009F5D754|nr:L,D-transpeptidase [Olsenella sp. HMSC062G07]